MEECWETWLSELESDDCGFYEQCEMTPMDGEWLQSQKQDEFKQRDSSSSNSMTICGHSGNTTSPLSMDESSCLEPTKVQIISSDQGNTDNVYGSSKPAAAASPSSYIICFDNCEPPPTIPFETTALPANLSSSILTAKSQNFEPRSRQYAERPHSAMKRSSRRSADHIITERLRRERITCKFIELSALIPGLKKTDKSSVLSDAINYLKQLKERIQILEEQNKKTTLDTVAVTAPKSQQSAEEISDTYSNSGDETSDSSDQRDTTNDPALEVEARVSGRDVMVRVRCRRERGMLKRIFTEIEKLDLSVLYSSAFPFGSSSLEVCIIAQDNETRRVAVKEIAKNIREALSVN